MGAPTWLSALMLASLAAGALGGPTAALAAPGDLDPTFGSGGLFIATQTGTEAADMALQPDGKIVVAGSGGDHMVVYRLAGNGSLDTSFGGDGIVDVTGFLGDTTEISVGWAVALQPDGKIVVAGRAGSQTNLPTDMAIARLNPDGSLDATFGGDGRVVVDFGASFFSSVAVVVAIQGDDKILVAGSVSTQDPDMLFGLARLGPDGILDSSFDGDGRVIVDITNSAAQRDYDAIQDLVLQPDGKIVAAGSAGEPGTSQDTDFCVARFNPDGSLDTTFGGGDGHTEVDFSGLPDIGAAVARQPDGKLVVGGTVSTTAGKDDFGLARLSAAGDLDATFGGDGRVTVDFPDSAPGNSREWLADLVLDPSGRIVAVGTASMGSGASADGSFGLARLQPDGSPDATFGRNGLVSTDVLSAYDRLSAAALQPDGKIVAAGFARSGADRFSNRLAAARYLTSGGGSSAVYLPLVRREPAERPLVNGDFEAGHSGWQEYSRQGYVIIMDTYYPLDVQHHGGNWGAWLGGQLDEISSLEQTVTVPRDRSTLIYWHVITSEDSCGHDFGGVVIDGGVVDKYDLCQSTATGGWKQHRVDLGRYAGQTVRLQLRVETDGSGNSNLLVDDVEFAAAGG